MRSHATLAGLPASGQPTLRGRRTGEQTLAGGSCSTLVGSETALGEGGADEEEAWATNAAQVVSWPEVGEEEEAENDWGLRSSMLGEAAREGLRISSCTATASG